MKVLYEIKDDNTVDEVYVSSYKEEYQKIGFFKTFGRKPKNNYRVLDVRFKDPVYTPELKDLGLEISERIVEEDLQVY